MAAPAPQNLMTTATSAKGLAPSPHAHHVHWEQCSCGVALEGDPVEAYNEGAFRYFFEIERKRAEASNRALLLLLVDLKPDTLQSDVIESELASTLFAGLTGSLRETDFVGWYREGRVAGAVLTQRAGESGGEGWSEITGRVTRALSRELPQVVSNRLQVRIFQIPSRSGDVR